MAKKNTNMEELKKTLGLGEKITGFMDGVDRIGYPVPLKDFSEFWENIQLVSSEKMWLSFVSDDGNALRTILSLTFRDEDVDDIMLNIYPKNYKEVIEQIFELNGIRFDNNDDNSNESKNK